MRFLPREEKFYHYFMDQANLIVRAAKQFREAAQKGPIALNEAAITVAALEQKGDEIIHEIFTRLNQTFITPMDPEDIHTLGARLDDVLDGIEDCVHRIVAYKIDPIPPGMIEMCKIIEECGVALEVAFRALNDQKPLLETCIEVNRLEEVADSVSRSAIAELFNEEQNPITIIKLKEIYEILEATADYCEDVADALQNVSVKNG
jgi:uncharacterized protein